jgi:putative integral membrane protein (TIGR02587 family)
MTKSNDEPIRGFAVDPLMKAISRENPAHPQSPYWMRNLARAFAGAAIFGLPLLMTMEMWWLGFSLNPLKLALFVGLSLPLLVGLAYYSGIRDAFDWQDDVLDAFTALAIGALTSALVMTLLGLLTWREDFSEITGKIAIQMVPAAMGAVLAREQLGQQGDRQVEQKEEVAYFGTLFLMAAGALYLAFNLAPTEEIILISFKMSAWHGIAFALFSVAILHAFVYVVGFYGQERAETEGFWLLLLRYSITGYAVTLLVSTYILWTFGRFDGLGVADGTLMVVILAFPGALGAAAARLIL